MMINHKSFSHCFNSLKPLVVNQLSSSRSLSTNTIILTTTLLKINHITQNSAFCLNSTVFVPRNSYSTTTSTKNTQQLEAKYPPETHILLPIERVLSFINISHDRYGWKPEFQIIRDVHISEMPVWAIKNKMEIQRTKADLKKLTNEERDEEVFQSGMIRYLVSQEKKENIVETRLKLRRMTYKCYRSNQSITLTTTIYQVLSNLLDYDPPLTKKKIILTAMGEELLSFNIVGGRFVGKFVNPLLSEFKKDSLLKAANGTIDIKGALLIPDELVNSHRWLKVKTTNKTVNYDLCSFTFDIFKYSEMVDRAPMYIFQRDDRYEEISVLSQSAIYSTKASLSVVDQHDGGDLVKRFENVIKSSMNLLARFLKNRDAGQDESEDENQLESEVKEMEKKNENMDSEAKQQKH